MTIDPKLFEGHEFGEWVSETSVSQDDDGLAVIEVIPQVEDNSGYSTPTRGMVAWINKRTRDTDEAVIARGALIAAAPTLLARVAELEGAMGSLRQLQVLKRRVVDSTMRAEEHDVYSVYDVNQIVDGVLGRAS